MAMEIMVRLAAGWSSPAHSGCKSPHVPPNSQSRGQRLKNLRIFVKICFPGRAGFDKRKVNFRWGTTPWHQTRFSQLKTCTLYEDTALPQYPANPEPVRTQPPQPH